MKKTGSSAKVIEQNIVFRYTQIVQHVDCRRGHKRGAAQIIFHFFGLDMVFQVSVQNNLMNEPGISVPVIFRFRLR